MYDVLPQNQKYLQVGYVRLDLGPGFSQIPGRSRS